MVSVQSDRGATPGVPVEVVRDLLHDLGSPLVAAQGFLALLERAPSNECAQRYRDALRESIEAMRERIDRARESFGKTSPL